MARGRHGDDLGGVGRREPLPVAQMLRACQTERVQRRADARRERGRTGSVVLVVVGHEDRRDTARRPLDVVQVGRDVGPGIDHH